MQNKEEKIIKEAIKLFNKFGYKKTSIDEITKKSQIAKGTFYLYFKDKENLYKTIINKILSEGKELFKDEIKKINGLKEKLIFKMLKSIDFFEKNPIIKGIVLGDENFFSQNLNLLTLRETHEKMVGDMIGNEKIEKNKISEIADIIWFFTYILHTKNIIKDEKCFNGLAISVSETIAQGIISKLNNK